jgi:hypothetical protein
VFTGRDAESKQVEACLVGSTNERRVCVVHGLGGAGKTQLALKTIERTRDEWTYVIYVDASSRQSIETTLQDFAQVNRIGDTYEDTMKWLESRREQWLLVFDNADDPSTNIHNFFPVGTHSSILITTRLTDLAVLAQGPGSVCRISSMNNGEALALLLRMARLQEEDLSGEEREAAEALLQVSCGTSGRLAVVDRSGRNLDV